MAKIIYLNGPSSSGKTLLAKALQDLFAEPYLRIGIDKMMSLMPAKLNDWQGGEAPLGFSWKHTLDPSGTPVCALQTGPFAKKITQTLKDIALLLASQNYNLIIDDVAFGSVEVDEWKHALQDYDAFFVGVTAPLNILEERENSRGDRKKGSARSQYFKVHDQVVYDVEIDTHKNSLEDNIAIIQMAQAR